MHKGDPDVLSFQEQYVNEIPNLNEQYESWINENEETNINGTILIFEIIFEFRLLWKFPKR